MENEKEKTALIVEDNKINAMIFETFMQDIGLKTILAENGAIAIEKIKEKTPDIVLMDIHMPVMTGLEAITEIRKMKIGVPIIAISASAFYNERDNSLSCGANEFMTKPVNGKVLKERVSHYL